MLGIFGMGYGFRTKHLFKPRKSVMTRTVLSFLGMMKVGAAHCDDFTGVRIPKDSKRLISFFVICSYALVSQTVWHKMVLRQG